jgi:fructoselysine-6-P-deglycase FrlB-like protein
MLRRFGIASQHEEASDVLHYPSCLPRDTTPVIYISQSGDSAEVQPLVDQLTDSTQLIAITNNPSSLLSRKSGLLLPMVAGEEMLIASKTYVNTLALLWLVAQRWSAAPMDNAFDALRCLGERADAMRRAPELAVEKLDALFSASKRVVFLGHGPHAASARQAAMTLSEWPKLPCYAFGVGAYRHGFIETADPSTGVILFTPPGRSRASALALAHDLASYGARVLCIENGQVLNLNEEPASQPPVDEFLSPILDILPVQWYAEAAARLHLPTLGFRYLSKVVSKL